MNHQKVYNSLIDKAKSENRTKLTKTDVNYVYYERHHIIPRCLKGNDEDDNLVLLTAREHYIAHKLLTHIYSGNIKIACAFFRMSYDKRKRKVSSRDFAYARELISICRSGKPSWSKGATFSDMHKYHMSETRRNKNIAKGKNNGMYHRKHSADSILKMSIIKTGIILSEERKNHISEATLGEKNPMYGKKFYDIWIHKYGKEKADELLMNFKNKQRLIASKKEIKICPYCGTTGRGAGIIRYHFNNCKLKKETI